MPTYADEMAARNPQNVSSRGPVRIWISSGEVVRGPDGRLRLEERWEEEEIMDTDVLTSVDSEPGKTINGRQTSLAATIRRNLADCTRAGQVPSGGSLLVLDTNTLLSSLPFCMAIFTQCLARNAHALSQNTFIMSSVMLIVPNTVVRELDNLKSSSRKDSRDTFLTVGQKAQRANRWILEASLQQKKRSYDASTGDGTGTRSEMIPEHAWVLHVENSAHLESARHDSTYRDETPDDEILSLCRILQRDTQQAVWFCSDDINAKLRAESDAILTFSVSDWVQEQVGTVSGDRDAHLGEAVSDLIDQWSSQVVMQTRLPSPLQQDHYNVTSPSSAAMEEDAPHFSPQQHRNKDIADLNYNRSTIDSIYADSRKRAYANSKPSTPTASIRRNDGHPMQLRSQSAGYDQRSLHNSTSARQVSRPAESHRYPADRSSASSMWAR